MIDELITGILKREGWDEYTNKPSDRGGPTKWGITQKAWSEWLGRPATVEDVKAITEAQARAFYKAVYIERPRFDQIQDEFLMEFTVDCGVNHGTARAAQWLQIAADVVADGAVGPKTLAAVNAAPWLKLTLKMIGIRGRFYAKIASDQLPADPDLPNLQGWMNRLFSYVDRLADMQGGS